jgi:hypothetical protein
VRARLAIPLTVLAFAGCGNGGGDRFEVARIYMGVSCGKPNSIRCDRVGLAVWSRDGFAQVEASIAGRPLTLKRKPLREGLNYYEGFLSPAGLLDGRLRVRPDGGRYHWTGLHPRAATVVLTAGDGRGGIQRVTRRVHLAPGWG